MKRIQKSILILASIAVLGMGGCTTTTPSSNPSVAPSSETPSSEPVSSVTPSSETPSSSETPVSSSSIDEDTITSITISLVNPVKETGYDAKLELGTSIKVTATYLPANVEYVELTFALDDTKAATIAQGNDGVSATITAKDYGEVKVYATYKNKNGTTVKSNELKIKTYTSLKTNKDFNLAKTTYTKNGVEMDLNVNTLYKNAGAPHQDPLGENHVLVVPFGFTDSTLTPKQNAETIERINKTFFGTEEEMKALGAQTSLATFYKTSSYGKTEFQGTVLPEWCVYNGTSQQFYSASGGNLGPYAAQYARDYYIKEYAKAGHGALGADAKPLSYFDSNNDGYIDLVWIVYSHPTGTTEDWWAYVTYTGSRPDTTNPTVNTLGFASIDWMSNSCNGYDFHTYTHETGHTYGLPDYYDYNSTWAPMGGIDFMDRNFGDHNMFSKFSLGWTKPWIVDDNSIITLRPGTTTGDCFIIPSPGYNGTAFDEYMMFELMAPLGLCAEYKNGYQGTVGYTKPGIRVTHVDSRAYKGSHDTYLADNPEDAIDVRLGNSYAGRMGIKIDGDYFPVENKSTGKVEKNYMTQLSLIESVINAQNWTNTATYNASNDTLFTEGKTFTLSSKKSWASTFMPSRTNLWNKAKTTTGWSNKDTQTYTIDQTCTFNYTVKVLSINPDPDCGYTATVQITKDAY